MKSAKLAVLVVEDDEGLRSQYRWLLSDYRVLPAKNRIEAMEIAGRERICLALVDLGLPPDPDGSAEAGCLSCIDPSKTGDITTSGKVWQYDKIKTTTSNASIVNDLLFIADHEGFVYCFDAQKGGKPFWKHDVEAKPWGSTLAADGKVYIGTSEGNLISFAASKEEKVLGTTAFGGSIVSTPVAANGTLYVATETFLYAISEKK